jgi:hypothetical protein
MSGINTELWQSLLEYRAKGVSQCFEELLTSSINIAEGIRSTASTSQQNLRKFLQDECKSDSGFPPVLAIADRDFLGGSFDRHTKTWPLDDIDIYLPLDGAKLSYYEHGAVLPYTVASDGMAWNPLLTPRWANGPWVSSSKLVEGFAAVLKRRFPHTKIKPKGQAVSVQMTQGANAVSDGLGYDIVPCFSLSSHHQNELGFYLMPDGHGGWIRTNPRYDAAIADLLQKEHNGLFRKVVKLLKYWNAEQLSGKLSSYFIELVIAKTFWDKGCKREPISVLSYGVALAFWAVQQAVLCGVQEPWVANAPPVYPGEVLAGNVITLRAATDLACAAWDDEQASRMASAAAKWKRIFGPRFPD